MRGLLTLPLFLCATLCYAQEKEPINRTWTSIAGTKVDAELVSFTDREVVLKLKQGKTIKLRLDKLAEYDRYFVKGLERVTVPEGAVKEYKLKQDFDEARRVNGEVIIPPTRKNGKLFSGISYRMHSKGGGFQTTKEGFIAGVEDDEYWSDDVWSITTYKRGVPNGVLKIFLPNGQKVAEGNADSWGLDSRGDGVWIFWDKTGKMIQVKTYKDGKIVNSNKVY